MRRTIGILASAMLLTLSATAVAVDDGHGHEWRQLYETTGVSWNDVALVCPLDGSTPCSGTAGGRDLTTWIWASDAQVIEFMGLTEPALLDADPPSLFGPEWFFSGVAFLGVMRYTFYTATEVDYHESTAGLTSTLDANGAAIIGSAAYGYYPISGGLGVGAVTDVAHADATVGVWLWRPIGPDYSPPVITPLVAGTAGDDGWYVSYVAVGFDVQDPESDVTSRVGCDPVDVTADTAGLVFTCTATSEGGSATASASVRRDATAPALACVTPAPVFELGAFGAQVSATVSDATSGPRASPVSAAANTSVPGAFTASVTGSDFAGNTATRSCPYRVIVPSCAGLRPTIVGTGNPDDITGTSGRDVIVGLGGSDVIHGGGGNDVICAGDGNDTVFGDAGSDRIFGDAGNDDLNGGNGNDTLDGGDGSDSIRGDAGDDRCTSGEVRMSSCAPF